MTMPENKLEVTTDSVLDLAAQLSNDDSQSSQQQPNTDDQRVPYDRFKEVNDERKALAEQNTKLMEMMQQFQNMQQQSQQQQVAQQTPTVQTAPTSLFTEDELNSFEQDIVLDPKSTLQRFGDAILTRGVDTKVKALEQTFEERLAALTGQITAQTIPTVIDNFKRSRFNPQTDAAEIAAFDQAVQGLDPSLLANQATLENVRLAAIGYVADQKKSQPQANQQAFFTESPSGYSGWGGLGGTPQTPQVPPQVIEAARKMGVDPKEAAAMYQAMNTSGVFR